METVDELIEICRLRGVTPQHLRADVHCIVAFHLPVGSPLLRGAQERSDRISNAGLAAQLSFLLEAWGLRKLKQQLEDTGGILDAIVRHVSSSALERDRDIGRDNIDGDGDVV